MRDHSPVGSGYCGVGVAPHLVPVCPFHQEPLCEACHAEVLRFVTEMQVRGRGRTRAGVGSVRTQHPDHSCGRRRYAS